MTRLLAIVAFVFVTVGTFATEPLRIFIRAGEKTHGPGQHDAPQFLRDWKPLLEARGAKVAGALTFPTAAQLDVTDVLIIFCQNGGSIHHGERTNLENFLKHGGGLVVLHDGLTGDDPQWFKTIVGGAWEYGRSKYFEGKISFYYQDHDHPITRAASNFDVDDEMYWDLHMLAEAHVLAATYQPDTRNTIGGKQFPSIYDIVPQMWAYETNNHRAFVSLLGHNYKTFNLPHYRATLLRAIAWAGKRDADLLVSKDEVASLRYPEGGPTAPEKAAASFIVHSGFDVNLVAAEPLIQKPISMDWDPRGRLWIAETPEYPAGHGARDRISILDDANGDGQMDKKSVFADGLELITSFVFYKDGVIVAQAPDIFWLRDTNHDGRAETKVPLYTGFGTFDRHAVVSNFRWSMDGWIYATLGYSRGRVKSADGKKDFGDLMSGVIRFRPDGSAMEQVASMNGNTWGVDIAPDGEVFFSQANGAHINHVVVPETDLARGSVGNVTSYKQIEDHDRVVPARSYDQQAYQQIDFVGGFTGASGCCIYNGGAWPDKFNNTCFVCEPTVNIVHQDFLNDNGVTYVASKERKEEFLASTDLWFRPIHARVGPDGALYLLDFYNQAIVHNDPRGPRHGPGNAAIRPDRDHQFGRIWRIQYQQARKIELPKFDLNNPEELPRDLENPNGWIRMTAHRLLVENNPKDVIDLLARVAITGSPQARVHALWVLQQSHALNDTLLHAALTDRDPTVIRTGLHVAAENSESISAENRQQVEACLSSSNPKVQLAALLAYAHFPKSTDVAKMIVELYPDFQDPWRQSAAVGLAGGDPLLYLRPALGAGDNARSWVEQLAKVVAAKQNAELAAKAVVLAAAKSAKATPIKALLTEVVRALKPQVVPPLTPALDSALTTLLNSTRASIATATLPLAARWDKGAIANASELQAHLLQTVSNPAQRDEDRAQAVTALLSVAPSNRVVLASIGKAIDATNSPALQKQVVIALAATGVSDASAVLIKACAQAQPEIRSDIFEQLIKRADWSLQLVGALERGELNHATLDPNAVYRLRKHANADVAKRANAFFDRVRGPVAEQKDALIAKFAPQIVKAGDAGKGHEAFLKNCAVCHTLNSEGKNIGPNLTGIGAHGREELLVHVLDPNRVVEPNFLVVSVETRDGEEFDGIVARENAKSIVLRNATSEHEIARADIRQKRNTGRSLMPEGFEALGAETLRNILAYICDPKTVAAKK